MKELSIEEKAKANDGNYKAYTELISRLEDVKDAIKKQNYGIAMDILYKPYPQFQITIYTEHEESEDEKIRKWLIRTLKSLNNSPVQIDGAYEMMLPAIDWLEKQGEQKPVDKTEPKFKVGDIITNGKITGKVDKNENNKYHGWFGYDKDLSVHYADIPDVENWHLWTIQDAKAGDVLEFCDHGRLVVGIVSFISKRTGRVDVYCLLEANNFKVGNYYALDTINPHPATKEQRDTLFAKMKEAGYEWDAEKKELRKIEQKPAERSEEDEKMLSDIVKDLVHPWNEYIPDRIEDEIKWLKNRLKSLRPQTTWKPSDEQMKALADALSLAKNCGEEIAFDLRTLHEQLKKLMED